uniref:Reverse transcriptase domain-containing protein n=1 Tax=Tanacetum cinerariifolium TaxID=118510 RepID=A0A6L2L337_TANCI|nr:reverse transcriptase domain-containing protein [Tanacetum cinerariifolium]
MDECLALADLDASINLMPLSLWNKLSLLELSPMFMTLELIDQVDAFLALEDNPTSPKLDQSYVDTEGGILLLENNDPSLPPPNQGNYLPEDRKELKIYEAKFDKSSIDEPPEVELKDLPPHLEYAFLKGGTFMKRSLEECYDLNENMIAHHNDWDTSAEWSESSSSITSSFDWKLQH